MFLFPSESRRLLGGQLEHRRGTPRVFSLRDSLVLVMASYSDLDVSSRILVRLVGVPERNVLLGPIRQVSFSIAAISLFLVLTPGQVAALLLFYSLKGVVPWR